jgi:hypothetical protein
MRTRVRIEGRLTVLILGILPKMLVQMYLSMTISTSLISTGIDPTKSRGRAQLRPPMLRKRLL